MSAHNFGQKKVYNGAMEMTQPVNKLAAKADDPRSIPGAHPAERENRTPASCPHTQINKCLKKLKRSTK